MQAINIFAPQHLHQLNLLLPIVITPNDLVNHLDILLLGQDLLRNLPSELSQQDHHELAIQGETARLNRVVIDLFLNRLLQLRLDVLVYLN